MEQLRASVRTLVEFTLHGEDIRPAGGMLRDMQEGVLGHKARQKLLGDGWEAEVPLSLTVPVEDEEAELLLPLLEHDIRFDEQLTHRGLYRLALLNSKKSGNPPKRG